MGGKKKQQPWGSKLTNEQMSAIGLTFKSKNTDGIDFGNKRMHCSEIRVSKHAMERMNERNISLCDAIDTERAIIKDGTIVTVLPQK